MDDRELLRQFVTEHSQAAFRVLVERHSRWLHSVCLRRLRDPGLAEDATQAVFLTLAQKAPSLHRYPTISPWLHQAAKFVSANMIRAGRRRTRHEREAGAMNTHAAVGQDAEPSDWDSMEQELEPAIDRLRSRDREAILLRFYEQKSHAEIARLLEISEAAAQKRLGRALERLRGALSRSGGTTLSALDVGALLAAHAVGPVPATLVASLAGLSASGVPAHLAPLTKGIAWMMTMTKLKAAAVAAMVVVVAVPPSVLVIKSYASAAVLSTTATAPAPTTAPAASNATPVDAVLALNDAILKGDPDAFAALHLPGTPDEDAYSQAVRVAIAAQGRFRATYRSKVDPLDKFPIAPTSSLMAIPPIGDTGQLKSSVVTFIDADTADVDVPGTLKYRVVRSGGVSRIQTQFSIASKFASNPAKAMAALTKMFNDVAVAYDTTIGEITSGTLATPDAVGKAIAARLVRIHQELVANLPLELVSVPFKFANDKFIPRAIGKDFAVDLDPAVRRTPGSPPAAHIKSLVPRPNDGRLVCGIGRDAMLSVDLAPLLGKRIRLSGWVKTRDARNWGGISLFAIGADDKCFVTADNAEQPVHGTTDWRQLQLVADVPQKATAIYVAAFLRGAGELWSDDFQLEVVSNDVPVNDDQGWQKWSYISPQYDFALDPAVQRNGHPTMCISSQTAPATAWCSYGRNERNPDKYLGRRAIMTAWIKTEGLTGRSGIWLRSVHGDNSHQIAFAANRAIIGTTGWKQYSVVVDVPYETQCLSSSIIMFGKGKMWVDLESVTYDVIDN